MLEGLRRGFRWILDSLGHSLFCNVLRIVAATFSVFFNKTKAKKRRNQDELDHRFLAFSFLYLSLAQLFFVHKIFIDSLAVRFGSKSCCKMHVFDTDYSIRYIYFTHVDNLKLSVLFVIISTAFTH